MKYLMCKDQNGTDSYYELRPGQEERISTLIREKRIPETFQVDGKTVISEHILGFTDEKGPSVAEQTSTSEGYERFRENVRQQAWYRKAKGLDLKVSQPSNQPDAITLVP